MDESSEERLKNISREYVRRVRCEPKADHSDFLLQQIAETTDIDEISITEIDLIGEYHRIGRLSDALVILRRNVSANPEDSHASICLAEHYHYYDVNYSLGKEFIAEAILKACQSGTFMYEALGVQARIAIESQDWSLLEKTLKALTAWQHEPGNADIFPERDFLKRIPKDRVDSRLVEAYESRVSYLRSIGYSTLTGPSV